MLIENVRLYHASGRTCKKTSKNRKSRKINSESIAIQLRLVNSIQDTQSFVSKIDAR